MGWRSPCFYCPPRCRLPSPHRYLAGIYTVSRSVLIIISKHGSRGKTQTGEAGPAAGDQGQQNCKVAPIQNAYCKFTYEKNHLTSKVHHNCGRSPDWNDELTFNVYNPQGTIWVEVFHQQPPHDILLGVGYIALKSLELDPYERKPCKTIDIQANWC